MLSCSGVWGVWSMVSVSLCATEFQGGIQYFGSVALYPTGPLGGLQTVVLVAQLLCVQRNYWNAFNLWCPNAVDLLGCLRMWYQMP